MGTFRDDVVVEQIGEGRFKAELDESWNLWPLPQGGIVTSLALRAAGEALGDPTHLLRTSTTTFAGQVTSGPLEIDVTILRHGRSATQATVSLPLTIPVSLSLRAASTPSSPQPPGACWISRA